MYTIPQRLGKIFTVLLERTGPVSIKDIASFLGVSRRTVFRELESASVVLKKFNISIETTVGEGLYLSGEQTDIERLKEVVEKQSDDVSNDKDNRRIALALLILGSTEWQKLYFFSSTLKVSEATVSLDMDILESELKSYNIQLLRKKGMGVFVNGTELNIRIAYVNYLLKDQKGFGVATSFDDMLSPDIIAGVEKIISEQSVFLNWMTKDAVLILSYRLAVQISRLKNGLTLGAGEVQKQKTLYTEVAKNLALELSYTFNVEIEHQELDYIVEVLRAARTKTKSEFYEDESLSFARAQSLAYRMIERFDSRLAPTLKTNEHLVRGLSVHLWSAIVRIENGYRIKDPLSGQVKTEYPDIYRSTENACTVLSEQLEKPIPEEEIACVATHFGAAVLEIGQNRPKRRLKVGIICLGGIGVSYMMAGQVKKFFEKEVITEIGELNQPHSFKDCDFLIATTAIPDTDKPVVVAHPLLTDTEKREIQNTIDKISENSYKAVKQEKTKSFKENVNAALVHLKNINDILENFETVEIQPDMTVDELSKFVGYRFSNSLQEGEVIFNNLKQREQMSSQLIEPLEIVLLHCCTSAIKSPIIAVLHPKEGYIVNESKEKAKSCFLILLPQNSSPKLKEAIGSISGAFVEDEEFLTAVVNGESQKVLNTIEYLLSVRLSEYLTDILGE